MDLVIERLAAISGRMEIRYWSASRRRWRPLLDQSQPLSRPDRAAFAGDPQPDDLRAGATIYSLQDDSDPLGPLISAMTIIERSATRLRVAFRNVSDGRFFGLRVLPAGAAEGMLFLEQAPGGDWRLYTLSRLTTDIPDWLLPPRPSYVNRAVALYRYLAGIPTDKEPPAWR